MSGFNWPKGLGPEPQPQVLKHEADLEKQRRDAEKAEARKAAAEKAKAEKAAADSKS